MRTAVVSAVVSRKKYGENAVVELAVDYGVKDIKKFIVLVELWSQGRPVEVIWKS